MRIYNFISEHYGFQELENRKLKVERLVELNDPFEHFCLKTDNYLVRKTLKEGFLRGPYCT